MFSSFCRSSTEQMLIKARQDQIHHKEHFLAVQAQRDREEFERVLRLVNKPHPLTTPTVYMFPREGPSKR